jgi:hypothetical protein
MIKRELNERSPLRILEKSTHGGLGKGNIGVICARKGVGKTACLVHIATDRLLRELQVIHVSFAADTRHIIAWYEDIFAEIARRFSLESARQVHDEIRKHRIIMNFNQEGIGLARVIRSIQAMIRDGQFSADCLVVDGYDFTRMRREEIREIKAFAAEQNLEIWFSVTVPEAEVLEPGIPPFLKGFSPEIGVLIRLEPKDGQIGLTLLKDHENSVSQNLELMLDPKTLLIVK